VKKSESIQDMDQETFNRKYGWKIAGVIFIIIMIVYYNQDPKTREAEKAKKDIESHFNPWNGSHIQLVEYVKPKLRDPSSFEHVETSYVDKGDKIFVTMHFRCKNGFGGINNSYAYAN